MWRRDLLARHVGERVFLRLTSGTQFSGILIRATRGELELARVRAVVGDTWQEAAAGSITGVDRSHVDYWQHVVTVVEPPAQVSA